MTLDIKNFGSLEHIFNYPTFFFKIYCFPENLKCYYPRKCKMLLDFADIYEPNGKHNKFYFKHSHWIVDVT